MGMVSRLKSLICCLLPVLVLACSPDSSSGDSTITQGANDTAEQSSCRMAAQSMIDVARQAVNDQSSRPERRESRRVLMEDWLARLAAGEDPCNVYADIGNAATTF